MKGGCRGPSGNMCRSYLILYFDGGMTTIVCVTHLIRFCVIARLGSRGHRFVSQRDSLARYRTMFLIFPENYEWHHVFAFTSARRLMLIPWGHDCFSNCERHKIVPSLKFDQFFSATLNPSSLNLSCYRIFLLVLNRNSYCLHSSFLGNISCRKVPSTTGPQCASTSNKTFPIFSHFATD